MGLNPTPAPQPALGDTLKQPGPHLPVSRVIHPTAITRETGKVELLRDRHLSSHLDQQQDSKTGYKLSLRKGRVRLVKSFQKDCHLTTGRGWEPGFGASSTEPMKLKTESAGGAQDTHPDTRTPATSWDLSEQDGHSGPPKPTPRSHQRPPEQRPDESETCGKGQTCSSSGGLQEPGGQGPPHPRCASESRSVRPLPHLLLLAPSDSTAPGCRPGFPPETLLCEAPFTVWVLSYFVPQMQNAGLNYRLNLLLNHHMDVGIQLPLRSTRPTE